MKKGLNIYKRKDGRYEARYIKFRDGKTIKYGYVYAKSYTEVRNKLLNINNAVAPIDDTSVINIYDIADEWLRSVKIKVKESTHAKYYYTVTNHIQNDIGSIPVKKITNPMIVEYTDTLMNKNLKPKTVRDILSVLSTILRYYKKNYNTSFEIDIIYPRVEKKNVDVLNDNEIVSLERYISNDIDLKKIGILLTLYTGLRIGEVCALRWENINLIDGYISIRQTIQRIKNFERNDGVKTKVIIDTPKSKSSMRQIPIPEFVIPILRKYANSPKAYLLTGGYGFVEPRTYQNYFKKSLEKCHIRYINFHCLRHTFATRCIKSGCDVKTLSEILGHSSVKITLDIYVHPSFEMKKANINKVIPLALAI